MLKMVDGTGIIGVDMVCPLGGTVSPPQPPNYDRVELEGAGMLVLPNSLDAPLERLELGGKTEQVQTTGKNLLDEKLLKTLSNYTSNGLDYYYYRISGLEVGKKYTVSRGDVKTGKGALLGISVNQESTNKAKFLVYDGLGTSYNNASITWEQTTGEYVDILFSVAGSVTSTTQERLSEFWGRISYVQLEKGTTATPYEPYTGGKPSPSPEYPQEIKSVGRLNEDAGKYEVDIEISGNFFDVTKVKTKTNLINNGDGSLHVINKSVIESELFGKLCPDLKVGETCVMRLESTGLSYISINGMVWDAGQAKTITQNILDSAVYFYGKDGSTVVIKNIRITRNTGKNMEYTPYRKPQLLTLTSDRPLTKWDRLVEQGGEIGWLYQSNTVVIDGSETWSSSNVPDHIYFTTAVNNKSGRINTSLCKTYKNNGEPVFNKKHEGEYNIYSDHPTNGVSDTAFVPPNETVTTIPQWKEWLNVNPIEMLYKTKTTEFIPLPQSEQNAIRALKTYYPTTVITADGGEPDPDIKVTYRKEK